MRKLHVIPFIAAWAFCAATGYAFLTRYAGEAGDPGTPPAAWPAATRLPLDPQASTLIMFLHPRCDCSRASLRELEKVTTRLADKVKTHIVFTRPPGMTGDFTVGPLWEAAQGLTAAAVVTDADGSEAARFGARTSGHVLLFDPSGHRLFTGGITPARGHEGDNRGEDDVVQLVERQSSEAAASPVFGCSLFGRALAALGSLGPSE